MNETKTGRLLLASVLAILVYGVIASILGTIMPTFQLSMEQKGNVALAQALGLILASVSAGPLVDNKGKKMGLVLGMVLIVIALYTLPQVSGYLPIGALFFLLGLGGGTIVTAANALVSDISEERRAAALNFLCLFFGLGGMATPFIAANIFRGDTVRLCYFAAVLSTAVLVVHLLTAMPGPRGESGFNLAEAKGLAKWPALYLLSLFMFLYVACEVGVWNWLASYLIFRGIEESRALNILSLGFAAGMLIGRLAATRIPARVPSRAVTLVFSLLMAVTTWAMLGTADPTAAWIAVFCAGLAMAPVYPTTLAIVADACPRATGTALGIAITAGWAGYAASSPVIGSIAGAGSANLRTALMLLPAASAVMIVVNLIFWPMVSRKRG